jgi:1-acyl-sn-glycerol-3-phosphate acyltransferase
MDRLASVLAPLARVTQPKVYGIENVPERGALFVGNHTLYAFLDLPFMMAELWTRRQTCVRGLGDHGHYAIPVWRNLLELCGMVRGTRENVRALMASGQNVLVFPGGAGEVFKGRGQKYQLLWKERLGFARLAIEFGYPIVPFAAVGAEEMLEVVADDHTPVVAQASILMRRLVGVPLPPFARGVGPTPVPRPERLYFWFGEPIDTTRFAGRHDDDAAARAVRDEVRAAVEDGIGFLQDEREADPRRGLPVRILGGTDLPKLATSDPDARFVTRALDAWNTHGFAGAAAWCSRWVQLEDPPDWPGASVWRGRDAAVARLEEVSAELGANRAEIGSARSVGAEVLVSMSLKSSGDPGARHGRRLPPRGRDRAERDHAHPGLPDRGGGAGGDRGRRRQPVTCPGRAALGGAQPRRSTLIAWAAISASPSAFGCTTTAFVPCSTGSIQRTPIGWQASWPLETSLKFT